MGFEYQEWWQKNGEAVRQRRRQRYHADPAYRKKQKKWSRNYRRKRQRELGPKEPELRSHRRPIEVTLTGDHDVERHVCWSVGYLAECIGRGRRTIESWERKGLIPRTPIWWSGIRYYSEGMIRGLADVLATRPSGLRVSDPLVYFEVLAAWKEAGYDRFSSDCISISELEEVRFSNADHDVMLLTVEAFARRIKRSRRTILHWERIGLLPETQLRYGEERVYTVGMCDAVAAAMDARGDIVRVSDEGLVREIARAWKREMKRLKKFGLLPRQGARLDVSQTERER